MGDLALDPSLDPGTCMLEVTVADPQARRQPRQASRWVEIDVASGR